MRTAFDRAEDMIRLLRVQKHDLLNHFQVVSGLIQLNQPSRALEYIWEVTSRLNQRGEIMRLPNPQLALTLLLKGQQAAESQVEVLLEIGAEVAAIGAGDYPFHLVEKVFDLLLEVLGKLPPEERVLRLKITGDTGRLSIIFAAPLEVNWSRKTRKVASLCQAAVSLGSEIRLKGKADGWELALDLPGSGSNG